MTNLFSIEKWGGESFTTTGFRNHLENKHNIIKNINGYKSKLSNKN